MKHIFILNPAAGKGNAESEWLPRILKEVKENENEFEIHRSLGKQEIFDYVSKRASNGDEVRFYACGGDGTVNDVMTALVGHKNAQLAIIPCGTGNDFVRSFTNRQNFLDLDKQKKGRVVPVDVTKCGDFYSINVFNVGVDCDVVVRASEIKSDKISGSKAYLKAVVDVLPKGKYYTVRYEKDGEEIEEQVMIADVANGKYYGGGFKCAPQSSMNDGLLDVCIVRPIKGLKLLKLLFEYHEGKHLDDKSAAPYIEYFKTSKFKLAPVEPVHASIDGEVHIFTETEFECLPGAINLVLPEGCDFL